MRDARRPCPCPSYNVSSLYARYNVPYYADRVCGTEYTDHGFQTSFASSSSPLLLQEFHIFLVYRGSTLSTIVTLDMTNFQKVIPASFDRAENTVILCKRRSVLQRIHHFNFFFRKVRVHFEGSNPNWNESTNRHRK